ncbi:uncharacterized protein LOC117643628 [Thrips palmi]|uniref:Uncharacterized protein LOC117643628 n=1 Tax=Thrips palmi TaxID=161013 RepID=A0A6P8YMW1_THRPL|nr:uncharacterized protein LOC117643628 [Thrips palmi]
MGRRAGHQRDNATASPVAVMAKSAVLVLLLAALVANRLSSCRAERIPSGIGPFRVELRSFNVCPAAEKCLHPEKLNIENMKIARDPNNPYKYTYNADVNVSVPVDDTYKTEVKVSRWSSLGWTNNVFKMTVPNPCSTFKSTRPDVFKQVSDLYYGGTVTDCPLPPVAALVRDFVVEAKPPSNVKTLPYGRFKAKIKLVDPNQECVTCYDVITDILPKRRQ